jgi:hypothetical protein
MSVAGVHRRTAVGEFDTAALLALTSFKFQLVVLTCVGSPKRGPRTTNTLSGPIGSFPPVAGCDQSHIPDYAFGVRVAAGTDQTSVPKCFRDYMRVITSTQRSQALPRVGDKPALGFREPWRRAGVSGCVLGLNIRTARVSVRI